MVKATCDRCLGEVNLPVSGVMNLYVKQNGREEGNEDDYIILSPEDDYLDVSSYLYETYMLNYPMRVVHPEGECDEDMQEVLHEYVIEEDDKPIDPRWNELKIIKKWHIRNIEPQNREEIREERMMRLR